MERGASAGLDRGTSTGLDGRTPTGRPVDTKGDPLRWTSAICHALILWHGAVAPECTAFV